MNWSLYLPNLSCIKPQWPLQTSKFVFSSPLDAYPYIHPVKYIVYYISRTTYIQKYRLIYPLVLFRYYNIRPNGELKKGNLTKTNVYTVEDLKASWWLTRFVSSSLFAEITVKISSTCAYQGVRNVSFFFLNFALVLNKWSKPWESYAKAMKLFGWNLFVFR